MSKKIYKQGAFLIIEDTVNGTLFELNSSDVQIKKENANVDLYNIIDSNNQSVLKVNLSDIVDANGDAYIENDWNTFRFSQVGARSITDVSAVKPKVYKALLTQKGTTAPDAIVLENTLGDIAWSYTGIGSYTGTLLDAFTEEKTFVITGQTYGSSGKEVIYSNYDTVDTLTIETKDAGSNINGALFGASILIKVYP